MRTRTTSRAEVSCMRRAPQLGIASQGLPFLRRRAILGHRGLHERLERARVDLLPFVDVDRPSRVAFQAGIEKARWVWDPGPRANVSFTTCAYASPVQTIPWCDQAGVPIHFHSSVILGSASRTSARMRARVSPRHSPQVADPLVNEPGSGFPGRSLTAPHTRRLRDARVA